MQQRLRLCLPLRSVSPTLKCPDYIINHELSSLAGGIALSCGRWLALANAALITTKHVQLEKEPEPDLKEPATHPSRDKEGYPLEGLDEV